MTAHWQPTFSYPLERRDRPRRFDNRASLLSAVQEICQVFEAGVGNTVPGDREGLRGFPWPTPVLGSGCLAISSDRWPGPQALIRGVQEELEHSEVPFGQQSPKELVEEFVGSLYRDRVQSRPLTDESTDQTASVGEEAARLTLLAARLTRFYHLVKADTVAATSRWGSDRATLDLERGHIGFYTQNIQNTLVEPITRDTEFLLGKFRPMPGGDDANVRQLTYAVLCDLREDFPSDPVSSKVLALDHVRQVTEIAWHILTRNTGIYPGWSDLLVALLLKEGRPQHASLRPKRRPLYRHLYELQSSIEEWFEKPTIASFSDALSDGPSSPRAAFYDAVAELLQAQVAALLEQDESRKTSHLADSAVTFPPATAFVTSFDLELEMALWRGGKAFSVVIPVHVQQRPEGKAALVWLICDLEPSSRGSSPELQLERLREGSNWKVFTSRKHLDHSRRNRPVIVRLSGSPLMHLPDVGELSSDLTALRMPVSEGISSLYHAVTVDEYTALQRSNAELIATQRLGAMADVPSTSLPQDFSVGNTQIPRFWLAFGAQLSDPAIRYQLFAEIFKAVNPAEGATQSTDAAAASDYWDDGGQSETNERPAQGIEAPPGGLTQSPDFALGGLAINHRIEDDDAGLLYWLEFTVVKDDCANFIDDLAHYQRHVEEPYRRPTAARCPLRNR